MTAATAATGQRQQRRRKQRSGDKGKTEAGQVPLAVSYVAEQYYLANSGDILASFLASV